MTPALLLVTENHDEPDTYDGHGRRGADEWNQKTMIAFNE